jgi:hypothetical protein
VGNSFFKVFRSEFTLDFLFSIFLGKEAFPLFGAKLLKSSSWGRFGVRGVKLSHLVSGVNQITLFDDTEEKIKLYQAMDRIRNRFGANAIMRSINGSP